ncbi:DUF4041 domain-containing protein [Nicoliella lavandulae]|uniref:DUF4041 domain-containing protein n=1 Tax=Nicoliella lavandulae TaxID=3082954 RepID=A0ABU8SK83_9LACO
MNKVFKWLKDAINVNYFKKKVTELNDEVSSLTKLNDDLKDKINQKLSLKEMEAYELINLVGDKKKEIDVLDVDISKQKEKLKLVMDKIKEENEVIENLKAKIGDLDSDSEIADYGLYNPNYEFQSTWQYKNELDDLRKSQKEMIKDKTAVNYNSNWTVNNSKALGRKMVNNEIKAILRSFNNECDEAIKKVRHGNYERIEKRINKSFEQHNKIYAVTEISLSHNYLKLKLRELKLAFEYQQKKEEEKEELREQRRIERENAALKREAEKQQKKLQKDVDHYQKAINELQERSNQEKENQGLKDEIEKLKRQISDKENESNDLDSRIYNAKAGYVYIISNIGAFGKNIFKIGVTRRMKPEERVNELSSASVPFKFDVHAFVYSSDAFALENKLHQRFNDNRVNLVNNRKEFFRIGIDEIKDELKKYDNVTVDFNEFPEADEYRQTKKIESNNKSKDELDAVLSS